MSVGQRFREWFEDWSIEHYILDAAIPAVAGVIIGQFTTMSTWAQWIVGVGIFVIVVTITSLVVSWQRRVAILGRRLADKPARMSKVSELLAGFIKRGVELATRDDALQWRESVSVTLEEVFGQPASRKFGSVSADIEKANCDLKRTVELTLDHLRARLARMHEGSIRSD